MEGFTACSNLLLPLTFPESAAQIQLRGEVGGSVTFHCPVDKQRTIRFFYFQKGDIYVNGYHTEKPLETPTWKNTRLDRDKKAVHMDHLNVSHSGDYHCHIQYTDNPTATETVIHLSLTGMSLVNLTFKTVSDCLSFRLIAVSNTLQHSDGIILYILYSELCTSLAPF